MNTHLLTFILSPFSLCNSAGKIQRHGLKPEMLPKASLTPENPVFQAFFVMVGRGEASLGKAATFGAVVSTRCCPTTSVIETSLAVGIENHYPKEATMRHTDAPRSNIIPFPQPSPNTPTEPSDHQKFLDLMVMHHEHSMRAQNALSKAFEWYQAQLDQGDAS